MLIALFCVCLAVIAFAYVGYPLLIALRALIWRCPYQKRPITPGVSLIIACHNEEAGISDKLENVLQLDYPQLQVIIASDGSTDATESILAEYGDQGVRLLRLPRTGKAGALNAAVAEAEGEILVFSDANSQYATDAIRQLVQPFADETIGGVAGNQIYRKARRDGPAAAGERSYWDFDRWMKELQSRSGSTISATGAIYAIRRELFRDIPEGVTDDFVTSTRVIEQGYRLVFEPRAVCFEPVAGAARSEFERKTRILTRGLYGVVVMRRLLNPFRYGFYSVQLASHKVIRRLVAIPLLVIACITPWLWQQGWQFQAAALAQAGFYGAAAVGVGLSQAGRRVPKPLAIPMYFCMVNAAVLVAVKNVISGRRISRWNPDRDAVPTAPLPSQCSTSSHSLERIAS
jgi:cellulose synthase/poly-beta-1,6-N-acetylglucosamine synthase-like glycosyltransferase